MRAHSHRRPCVRRSHRRVRCCYLVRSSGRNNCCRCGMPPPPSPSVRQQQTQHLTSDSPIRTPYKCVRRYPDPPARYPTRYIVRRARYCRR